MVAVAAWNCESYRGPDVAEGLRDILRPHPEVAALSEMLGNRQAIRRVRKREGYRRLVTGRLGDMASTGLLVRKDIPVRQRGVIRVRSKWYGPNGRIHDGRGFPFALAELDGRWTWVIGVHMPWNADKNPGAVAHCWEALADFATEHPNLPMVFVGDWNASPSGPRAKALADLIGGHVVRGHGVDFAIARGWHLDAEVGPEYGSDHHSIRYPLTQGRTK